VNGDRLNRGGAERAEVRMMLLKLSEGLEYLKGVLTCQISSCRL
jgi:hypothetical protein